MSLHMAGSRARRTTKQWDAVAHSASLVVMVIISVIIVVLRDASSEESGIPLGLIAFAMPLGPLAVAGVMRATGYDAPRGFRSLMAFTLGSAVLIGVSWLGMQAGQLFSPLAYFFPVALLAFALGVLNYLLVVCSRTIRAFTGDAFDYPWIPDRVARLVGLPDKWME